MSARSGPPTLQDVARRAGVHPATVSRALGRPEMVAPETRDRVLAAVEALGFVPNRHARHLAGGSAEAVGVIVPDIANPYFATMLQSIQAEATGRDLEVLIADSGGDPATEQRMLETLSRRVDGIVVCTPVSDLAGATVPVVQVNRQSRQVPSVVVDQATIVTLAVDHLTALGHRHLAYLHGPLRYWSSRRRTRAVQRIARERRGELRIEVVHPVAGTFEGGRGVLETVLATGATGVLAFNDVQAAGLVVGAHAAGLRVPGDLSIVGSDGLDLATMIEPTLTTVVAPRDAIGRTALARLVTDDGPTRTVLQPALTYRGSSGRPGRAAPANHSPRRLRADAG
ncbi:MAG TPA: LacI family DNA-binding transcriptional regulator [Acidimicrobiales bacterium]|nr:LacI family DNA-binding transcriptional regulator [Acidimicrobiales bacterium]